MRRILTSTMQGRCPTCGISLAGCICAQLPRFQARPAILFLQHPQEERKPTNSTRLTVRLLGNTEIRRWERTAPDLPRGPCVLLYPFPEASVLAPADLERGTVVIPDGTWAQAARIANVLRRNPALEVRRLPEASLQAWRLRQATENGRFSSGQAAAMVLEIAGEPDASRKLIEVLDEAARRMLQQRGIMPPGPSVPATPPPPPIL